MKIAIIDKLKKACLSLETRKEKWEKWEKWDKLEPKDEAIKYCEEKAKEIRIRWQTLKERMDIDGVSECETCAVNLENAPFDWEIERR